MATVYIVFTRCELSGGWDYAESDKKSYYEAKNEPAVVDIWTDTEKKESYKFKKGAMIRVTNNLIRISMEDTK